jgi:NADPH:quinone reductase
MRAAFVNKLEGINRVELGEQPDLKPATGQALIKVHAAAIGPWDVGIVNGAFPGVSVPYVPSQEVAGVVEAVGDETDVQPGDQVFATLFPAGGGFAEYAVAEMDSLALMPERASFEEAAALVIGGGTAYEGLVDRGHLRAGETVLVTAASGGVGHTAVQIAAAVGARPLGVASARNHEYLRSLGVSEVFDYHASDWIDRVLAAVPGGVDLLLDAAGGETRDQAVGAVRDDGRVITLLGYVSPDGQMTFGPRQLERGITGESFGAHITRQRLEALSRMVDAGQLRAEVEAVLPLEQARQALERVAGGHTRGKVVVQIGE